MKPSRKKASTSKDNHKENQTVSIEQIETLIQGDEELAKAALAKLSGSENSMTKKAEQKYEFLKSLSKPSFVDSVKNVHASLVNPNVEKKVDIPQPVKQHSKLEQEQDPEDELLKTYPLYKLTKKIAYANGDVKQPHQQSIINLHKFLTDIADILLDTDTLNKYIDHERKSGKKGDKNSKNKIHKLKKFLQRLFPQEYFKFFQFNKITRNLKNLDAELANEDQIDESKLFNYESENESDDDMSFKLINSNLKDEEKAKFNQKRLEHLTEEEYQYLMDCRSTNFYKDGKDKFMMFLDIESRGLDFLNKNKAILEFISYIMCKQIANVIENIVRNQNQGVLKELDEPIHPTQIDYETEKNKINLKAQIKKIIREAVSIEELAFKVFQKEYHDLQQGIPGEKPEKQVKLSDTHGSRKHSKANPDHSDENEESKSNDQSHIQQAWKKLGPTGRKQWVDRILAEKQIKDLIHHPEEEEDIDSWDDIDPANYYAQYLINNIKDVADKSTVDDVTFRELFHRFQNNDSTYHINHEEHEQEHQSSQQEQKTEAGGTSEDKVEENGAPDMLKKLSSSSKDKKKGGGAKKRRLESIFD